MINQPDRNPGMYPRMSLIAQQSNVIRNMEEVRGRASPEVRKETFYTMVVEKGLYYRLARAKADQLSGEDVVRFRNDIMRNVDRLIREGILTPG
jgi:hypothetical protein